MFDSHNTKCRDWKVPPRKFKKLELAMPLFFSVSESCSNFKEIESEISQSSQLYISYKVTEFLLHFHSLFYSSIWFLCLDDDFSSTLKLQNRVFDQSFQSLCNSNGS